MTEPLVHVIDDDEAVRVSIGFRLEMADLPNRTYAGPLDFLAVAASLKAGCIVTDVRMPDMSGLELIRRLRDRGVTLPVIVITGHGDLPLAVEALREGVKDFIEKPFDDEVLLAAIRRALAVPAAPAGGQAGGVDNEGSRFEDLLASLSQREREVLEGVVAGKLNKTIGYELGISPRTVEVYRAKMMHKTGAMNLSELVRIALKAGF
jgi:two-component system response regulator FixJ